MDSISADEIAATDAGISEDIKSGNGNEVQVIQTVDELAHGHKVTGSQSSIEYEKSGDSRRRSTCPRSKSFLEEPSRSKAANFMQRKPGGKCVRSTHGSHGDGICHGPPWDSNNGLAISDSIDRVGDQEKKLQLVINDNPVQAGGVTQKLFDSNVTFADLVRVCTAQENNFQISRVQLGNTLLSTVHASTLVSNYLNTYRSYLDQLRKTCGRGSSQVEVISSRAPAKSVPLVLPLARMTPVFSDDSREDPEFLELLKKTTTESIRKLWPHPSKTNIVRKAGLVDTNECKDQENASVTANTNSTSQDICNTETCKTDTSFVQYTDSSNFHSAQSITDAETTVTDHHLNSSENPFICDNKVSFSAVPAVSTNNQDHTMKSSAESVLVGDGGSANTQNKTLDQLQKRLLKTPTDSLKSGDNFYRHVTESSGQLSNQSSNWSDDGQQKCATDTKTQPARSSALDAFLQQQQKLIQQQQLQRQILQHQQQQQQLQQQQRQHHQMLQQYQQQQEQHRQQSEKSTAGRTFGLQSSPDAPKSWLQETGENSGLASYRACLSASTSAQSSSGALASQQMGQDSFSNGHQTSLNYYTSNNVQPASVLPSALDTHGDSFSDAPAHTRTLKASYACLDPSNPMTLSVDPLYEYSNDGDGFMNHCELSQYDRPSFSNMPLGYGPSAGERVNCSETSRSWAEISRPITILSDNDPSNTGTSLDDRLRRAYARSRISQLAQQGQWGDSTRMPVQRPIVKMNSMLDNSHESVSYNFQNQRGFLDSNARRTSSAGFNNVNPPDRWNRFSPYPSAVDTSCNDGMSAPMPEMPDEEDGNFVPLQSPALLEHNSRMSRLYQWKQEMTSSQDTSYFSSTRLPSENTGMPSNDNAANSLLSGLQLDRDFSWNASSMSSPAAAITGHSALTQNVDHCGSGTDKFSNSYLNKLASLSVDQRRQLSNNNNASMLFRGQNDQMNESNLLFDSGEPRHQSWFLKGRQSNHDDAGANRISSASCGPVLSQSMQILNNKILAAQNDAKVYRGERGLGDNDADLPCGKDGDNSQTSVSPVSSVDAPSTDSMSKLRLNRAFSDPNNAHSIFKTAPHSSASLSQLSVLQQQQQQSQQQQHQQQQAQQKVDSSVFKLSEELEKTCLDDMPSKTPWHELASQESNENDFGIDSTIGSSDKYIKFQNFDGSTMILSDQEIATLRSSDSSRVYGVQQSKDQLVQGAVGGQMTGTQIPSNQQVSTRPRMILGANSLKQTNEDKVKAEVEESNRRLREMLGLAPSKDQSSSVGITGMRMHTDSSQIPQQSASPGLLAANQMQGSYNPNNSQTTGGQISRMQVAGGKIQTSMGMTQQMYCVPNILMPPPPVQSPTSSRQSNVIPIQGVMTSMGSTSRFPQGMIRVPFVDMSRLVYVHQMPMNMSTTHPTNNNHNNSSSSNPHVNTSNIITINTSDNDFSANGQGDKSGRHIRSNPVKNKTAFLKMRSGSEEFAVPILGMRPSLDDSICPRLIKTRTNPWDQDLDHDFSNSLISKAVSMENMTGLCSSANLPDPSLCNPEVGMLYQDISSIQGSHQSSAEQSSKAATFMHWPASADMHPEMLDMLPVRRAMPEDCGTGRLCWPEMEFLMSSREQLQTARRSNKPMGSNKANLISIIPKGNATDGPGGGKDSRFEKMDTKLL